jgi:hypothetical protein
MLTPGDECTRLPPPQQRQSPVCRCWNTSTILSNNTADHLCRQRTVGEPSMYRVWKRLVTLGHPAAAAAVCCERMGPRQGRRTKFIHYLS